MRIPACAVELPQEHLVARPHEGTTTPDSLSGREHPLALVLERDEQVARKPTLQRYDLVVQFLEVRSRARSQHEQDERRPQLVPVQQVERWILTIHDITLLVFEHFLYRKAVACG